MDAGQELELADRAGRQGKRCRDCLDVPAGGLEPINRAPLVDRRQGCADHVLDDRGHGLVADASLGDEDGDRRQVVGDRPFDATFADDDLQPGRGLLHDWRLDDPDHLDGRRHLLVCHRVGRAAARVVRVDDKGAWVDGSELHGALLLWFRSPRMGRPVARARGRPAGTMAGERPCPAQDAARGSGLRPSRGRGAALAGHGAAAVTGGWPRQAPAAASLSGQVEQVGLGRMGSRDGRGPIRAATRWFRAGGGLAAASQSGVVERQQLERRGLASAARARRRRRSRSDRQPANAPTSAPGNAPCRAGRRRSARRSQTD